MNFALARVENGRVLLGAHAFPKPDRLRVGDGPVVVGLRPSDLRESGAGAVEMRVTVELVERLGSEVLVVFPVEAPAVSSDAAAGSQDSMSLLDAGTGRTTFTARLDAAVPVTPGAEIALFVDPAAFHFFDPATGRTIGRDDDA
jgi:multiple sugar transport system ATP-binding protein